MSRKRCSAEFKQIVGQSRRSHRLLHSKVFAFCCRGISSILRRGIVVITLKADQDFKGLWSVCSATTISSTNTLTRLSYATAYVGQMQMAHQGQDQAVDRGHGSATRRKLYLADELRDAVLKGQTVKVHRLLVDESAPVVTDSVIAIN